jgi:hypothetical protein
MKNSLTQVDKNWSLSLTPKSDAFSATGVVDGHNVWRNQSVVKSAVNLPQSIPATVPGCIHTDLIAANIIADISVDGREDDQMWIWKIYSKYSTMIKKSDSLQARIIDLSWSGILLPASISMGTSGSQRKICTEVMS